MRDCTQDNVLFRSSGCALLALLALGARFAPPLGGISARSPASFTANRGHMLAILAHLSSPFATRLTSFLGTEFMGGAALMRDSATLAGDSALLLSIHRGEAPPIPVPALRHAVPFSSSSNCGQFLSGVTPAAALTNAAKLYRIGGTPGEFPARNVPSKAPSPLLSEGRDPRFPRAQGAMIRSSSTGQGA